MVKSLDFIINITGSLWKVFNVGVVGIWFMFLKYPLEHKEHKKGASLDFQFKKAWLCFLGASNLLWGLGIQTHQSKVYGDGKTKFLCFVWCNNERDYFQIHLQFWGLCIMVMGKMATYTGQLFKSYTTSCRTTPNHVGHYSPSPPVL